RSTGGGDGGRAQPCGSVRGRARRCAPRQGDPGDARAHARGADERVGAIEPGDGMSAFGRPVSKREAIAFAVVAVVALAALAVVAYHAVFSSFFEYDDEGELLLYLRDYGSGTHLYNTMYSEYGPGYFALLS